MLPLSRLGECRTIAALFVVALLVCHGALGGLHLACAPSGVAGPAADHAATHHVQEPHGQGTGSEHGGCPGDHDMGGAYYAALLGVLLAFALLLVLGAKYQRESRETGRLYEAARPVSVPILPRGPTLPRLQVFRL